MDKAESSSPSEPVLVMPNDEEWVTLDLKVRACDTSTKL